MLVISSGWESCVFITSLNSQCLKQFIGLYGWRKSLTATTQECCEQFWTNPWSNIWPSSGDFTATSDWNAESCNRIPSNYCLHSCCHVFDQVNLWPAWVSFETAIFWQCSPGTVETQRLYPLRHEPRRASKDEFFGLINPIICSPYLVFLRRVHTEFVIVFNWNHLKMIPFKDNYFYLFLFFWPRLLDIKYIFYYTNNLQTDLHGT